MEGFGGDDAVVREHVREGNGALCAKVSYSIYQAHERFAIAIK